MRSVVDEHRGCQEPALMDNAMAFLAGQPPQLGNSPSPVPREDTGGNDNIAVHLGFGQ